LIDEAKRESLAAQRRQRAALAAREAELREQRARDRAAYLELIVARDAAFAAVRVQPSRFASSVRALNAAESAAQDASVRAEEPFLSERQTVANLATVVPSRGRLRRPDLLRVREDTQGAAGALRGRLRRRECGA
jgi:hypothetical protein